MPSSEVVRVLGGEKVLGREIRSDAQLEECAREGFPVEVLRELIERAVIFPGELYGWVIPRRTLAHRLKNKQRLSREESNRVSRVARIYGLAIETLGALGNCTNYSAANGTSGYDADDNLTVVRSGTAITTQYQYDNLNRRKEIDYDVGGSSPSNVKLTYDLGDRLTQSIDSASGTITRQYGTSATSLASGLDFMTQEVTPQGTVNYTPDKAGRRITMTAGSQAQVTYGYDNADKLTAVTQGSSSPTKTYGDPAGRLSSVKLPNGVTVTYGYDKDSHVNSLTYKTSGGTTIGNLTYGYDADGRRVSVGGSFARTSIPAPQTFTYNVDNSLKTIGSLTVANDADGNITCMITTCPEFAYDARGHLAQAGVSLATTDYSYDAFGRRYQVATSTNTSTYLYDGLNAVQLSSSSGTDSYLGGLDLDEHFGQSAGGVNESFLRDPLGSTVAMTDSSGTLLDQYTYDPYGNTSVSGSSTTTLWFTGREGDVAGYYMRNRYYSPAIGRFISRDPAGLAGGINLYAYAGDSPTNFTDSTGLNGCDAGVCSGPNPTGGGGGGGIGVGVGVPSFDFSGLARIANFDGPDVFYKGQSGGGLGEPLILAQEDEDEEGLSIDGQPLTPEAWGKRQINEHIRTFEVFETLRREKGNYSLGWASSEDAARWGKEWVGPGYRVSESGKAWISQNGLRQFRPPSYKPGFGRSQANFQSRYEPKGVWINNGHLDIAR